MVKGFGRLILLFGLLVLIISFTFVSLTVNLFGGLDVKNFKLNLVKCIRLPCLSRLVYLGDINGDKKTEIIIRTNIVGDHRILIFDASAINEGPIVEINVSRYIGNLTSLDPFIFGPFIGFNDVNRDGILDIVIAGFAPDKVRILCLLGDMYELQWSTEFNLTRKLDGFYGVSGVLSDINGDGVLDVIVQHGGFIFAVSGLNGSLLWDHRIDLDYYKILSGDINGDGRLEVIFISQNCIYAFAGDNGKFLLRFRFLYKIKCSGGVKAKLIDIDGDGCDEIIYAMDGRGIYCFCAKNNTPKYLWSYNISRLLPLKLEVVFERGEYVVILLDDEIIYAFSAKNGKLKWSRHVFTSSISIDDVNNDGSFEILCGENTTFYYFSVAKGSILHKYRPNIDSLLSKVPESESLHVGACNSKFHHKNKTPLHLYVEWLHPTVYNLDSFRKNEVIVGVLIHARGNGGSFILILNSKGRKVGETYIGNERVIIKYLKCFDVDSDGTSEIVVLTEDVVLLEPNCLCVYKVEVKPT